MKLTIQNDFGKLDSKVWIKDQEQLEIAVVHPYSDMLTLYAIVNGVTQKVIKNKFTIKNFLTNEFKITIKVTLNGTILKNVACETLKIVKLDGNNVAIPEIETLKNEIERLAIEINELKLENIDIKEENAKLRNYIQTELGGEEDE